MSDRLAAIGERSRQGPCHVGDMVMQAAPGDKNRAHDARNNPAAIGFCAEPGNQAAGKSADCDGSHDQHRAQGDLRISAMAGRTQSDFEDGNQAADPSHRVGNPSVKKFGVAEQNIQREGEQSRLNAETPSIDRQNWDNWF